MQYKPSSSSINNDTSHFLNSDNNQTNQDQHGIQHHDIQTQQQQRQLQHHEQLLQRSHKYFIQEREQRLQRDGYRPPPLLALPGETLTGIAAYLAPPSLLALGQVSRGLAELIRDDHTWRVSFLCGWIGVSPNSSPESGAVLGDSSWKTLLLDKSKRDDRTWREEYIWRYVMINRWSYSSNPTSTHAPVHSIITGMRLVALGKPSIKISPSNSTSSVVSSAYTSQEQENELGVNPTNLRDVLPAKNIIAAPTNAASVALLSSSIQYGIVARSQPTLARVGTGFIDAVGGGRAGRRGWPGLGAGWIGNGLNGNPNMQFRPDVVSCDISVEHVAPTSVEANPDATTPHVYVIWGTRTGEVVLTHAARALDGFISGGTGARSSTTGAMTVKRSGAGEGHEGIVKDVKWIVGSLGRKKHALTAGVDGRVKLWEVNYDAEEKQVTMRCVWTSSVKERAVSVRAPVRGLGANASFGQLIDECVRVEGLVVPTIGGGRGKLKVVCVTRTGDIRVWLFDKDDAWMTDVKEVVFPRPRLDGQDAEQELYSEAAMPIALAIDPTDPTSMSSSQSNWDARFLVAYQDDSVFYRVTVRLDQVEATPFGNLAFGPISVVDPHFARQGRESRSENKAVILVGDRMGCVSVYSWDAAHSIAPIEEGSNNADVISPFKSFEAHRDGATVTAIFWDGLVLVTGSARGTTHVFDALTFQHIRSFVAPFKMARGSRRTRMGQEGVERDREKMAVRQILVNSVAQGHGDVLVVAVGDVVMAWQAGRAERKEYAWGY
ncbi:hypothetical protein D9613_009513 [Agrocybe pediades]|uniref:F-box domain-containing protein n=1 Tax=Agrocybe pediades TaxID=84607 RepID=A0A8H4R3S5_9AGAR|nr:hypothetical protein D9613_009513 [Agrocybe pediades]